MQLQYQTARRKGARVQAQTERRSKATWLDRLRVSQKLSLMAVLLGLPVIVLTGLQLRTGFIENNRIIKELHGLQTIGSLATLISGFYDFTYGHVYNTPQDIKSGAAGVNSSILDLESRVSGKSMDSLKNLKGDWASLQISASNGDDFTLVNNFQLLLQYNQQQLMDNVLSEFGLDTDPNPANTATMQGSRWLAKTVSQMQLVSLDMAQFDRSPGDPLLTLITRRNMDIANDALVSYESAMNRAYAYDPALKTKLHDSVKKFANSTREALNRTDSALKLGKADSSLEEAYSTSLRSARDAFTVTLTNLGQQMMSDVKRGFLTLALQTVAVIAALIAAALLLTAIIRRITQPLHRLTDASLKLSQGEYEAVPVTSSDELGTLTSSFNTAAEQLRENAQRNQQERMEAQKLQQNIGEFLDVTMDIAEGDLTKRGKVTGDVLGSVVDSINLMADELSQVLHRVQNASASVQEGSQAMRQATEQIQQGTRLTTEGTQRAAQQAREMNTSIMQMAAIAQATAESARRALNASEQGQQAVKGTLSGMENIRAEVHNIAKRIKDLGTRSQQIEEIVETISHISSQVNLLSLHASIEAAGAGEAGTRFAVVAEEIRELADLSTEATQRVANLITSVQKEIQSVIVSVEDGSREVEAGYQVAGQAGDRLREIAELAQVSAHFAQNISNATKTQVQTVQHMSGAVQQIAAVARDSQDSVSQGRQVAEQLETLAQQLSSNLSRFRLPGNVDSDPRSA